jgi:hypothetical protein
MSAQLLASLPLQARFKPTTNRYTQMRGMAAEQNRIAKRVVDYLHHQILSNPEKHQRYTHEEVGAALGIAPRKVQLSLAHAGNTGISLEVTTKCRSAIKKSMRRSSERLNPRRKAQFAE